MLQRRTVVLIAALVLVFPLSVLAAEKRTVRKTYEIQKHDDINVDVKIGEAKIESLRIDGWPSHDEIDKGKKHHDISSSVKIVFTYTNKDEKHAYKCKYSVALLDKDGKVLGEADVEHTLDKGKHKDTNKVPFEMHAYRYDDAKKIQVIYDMKEKD
jgi:hypothetical protein